MSSCHPDRSELASEAEGSRQPEVCDVPPLGVWPALRMAEIPRLRSFLDFARDDSGMFRPAPLGMTTVSGKLASLGTTASGMSGLLGAVACPGVPRSPWIP